MPYKEVKIEKMFYSIGEVADMFGVNTSLIRFWANTFTDIIKPQKNKKGPTMESKENNPLNKSPLVGTPKKH